MLTYNAEGQSWLARSSVVDGGGNIQAFYGKPENVQVLARQYRGLRGRGDAAFHRAVDGALGYPEEAIEAFVSSHQRGDLLRHLGTLLTKRAKLIALK